MDIKVLGLKNILTDENGEEYLDLSAPSFTGSYNSVTSIIAVTSEYAMRPDLVALDHMSGSTYMDALLKVNLIFNPFSVEEGSFLLVPGVGNDDSYFKSPIITIPVGDEASNSVSPNPTSQLDNKRLERVKQIADKQINGVSKPLSPNMLQPGELPKQKIEGGSILLGSNMKNRDSF